MAMTETQRTTLYGQLTDAIGQEAARTLMEQLPPSGWDQVATKDDVKASERLLQRELKASEKLLQRELKASEKMLRGELKETEGRLTAQIADSEMRQGARIDETNVRIDETNVRIDGTNVRIDGTNARIDGTNARIDETNRKLSELKDAVRTGFAELQLTLAKNIRWMAAVLLGFAVSMAVPLTIALL